MTLTRSTTADSAFKTIYNENGGLKNQDYYVIVCVKRKDDSDDNVRITARVLEVFTPYLQVEYIGDPTPEAFMQQFDFIINGHTRQIDLTFCDDIVMAIKQGEYLFDDFLIAHFAVEKVEQYLIAAKYQFTLKKLYKKSDVEHYKLLI